MASGARSPGGGPARWCPRPVLEPHEPVRRRAPMADARRHGSSGCTAVSAGLRDRSCRVARPPTACLFPSKARSYGRRCAGEDAGRHPLALQKTVLSLHRSTSARCTGPSLADHRRVLGTRQHDRRSVRARHGDVRSGGRFTRQRRTAASRSSTGGGAQPGPVEQLVARRGDHLVVAGECRLGSW